MKSSDASFQFFNHLLIIMFLLLAFMMNEVLAQETVMQPYHVIESAESSIQKSATPIHVTYLQQDEKVVSRIIDEHPKELLIKIPLTKDLSVEISLERYDILTENTQIVQGTNSGDIAIPIANKFVSYRGHNSGASGNSTILSFTPKGTFGSISTEAGQYSIEPSNDQKNLQVVTRKSEDQTAQKFICGVEDKDLPDEIKKLMTGLNEESLAKSISSADYLEVKVAIEADYEFYQLFQGNAEHAIYNILNTLSAVSDIYEREINIRLVVSYVRVWTIESDPYTSRDTYILFEQFKNYWIQNMTDIDRNFAYYLTSWEGITGASGLGTLGGIKDQQNAFGLSGGGSFTNSLTFYVPDVYVISHEIGHILGSPHTHSCSWPGGPIDSCYAIEGDCYSGATIQTIGTIMSYCGQKKSEFHPLCKELIRSYVENALAITVVNSTPVSPVLLLPGINETSVSTTPSFSWNIALKANQYDLQISTTADFTTPLVNTTIRIPRFIVSGLTDNSVFYWRVRGKNDFGEGAWSETRQFTTGDGLVLAMPVIFFPGNGTVAVKDPLIFKWWHSTGATSYEIQVGDIGGNSFDYLDLILSDTFYVADAVLAQKNSERFKWRVRAINGTRFSEWSAASAFWRTTPPGQIFPGGYSTKMPTTLPLIWYSNRNATSSNLEVSENADFTGTIFSKYNISPPTPFSYERPRIYELTLDKNKTYYWRTQNNFLDTDGLVVTSAWVNSNFTTGDGTNNSWNYYNSSNSPIKENIISDLAIGNNGEVWVCLYQQGIGHFDGKTWTFYDSKSTNGLMSNDVSGIYVDRINNVVWAGGTVQFHPTIFRFENNNWTAYNYINSGLPSSGELFANGTIRDVNGVMWFSTGMFGLIKFDGVDWTIFNTSNSLIPTNDLSKLLCAPDGTLWIGTENAGLVKFDGSNWINYTPLNSPLLGNNVQDLLLDKNNNIWIGCYEGLSKLNGTTWEAYKSGTEGNPLSSSDCFAIDKNGNVWMGGSGGVAKYNGQSWETYYFSNSPNAAGRPGAMTIDDMGKVWIGSDGEGLVSFNPNIISNVVKRESGNFKYSIIPNPNKGIFSFRIDSNPPAFFTLKLVNSSGKILETRAVKSAGINYIGQFNISHMSKGIYFLLVSTDKYHFSEKIVVI